MNDLIKCLTCAIIGVALGIEMKSTDDWRIQAIAIAVSLVILILLSVLFKTDKKEKKTNNVEQKKQTITTTATGESTQKEPVDIDLSMSAMSQMISKQHAVLNYTNDGWCIDDIDSKNGTRVRKLSQNAIMDVKLVGSVQLAAGDIIYIASTMLQLR